MSSIKPSYVTEHKEKFKEVLNEFNISSFSNQMDKLIEELQEIRRILEYILDVEDQNEEEDENPHIKSKPIDI